MELFFNSVWVLLSIAILCLWLRIERRDSKGRHLPLVALGLLIVLLFPVISVSDDLLAAQNPAEVEIALRQDHKTTAVSFISFAIATLPPSVITEPLFCFLGSVASVRLSSPVADNPAMAAIQNRPPPAA